MRPLFACILLLSLNVFSQEKELPLADNKEVATPKNIALVADNIKKDSAQLINHKEATLIDSLWLSTMYNSPLYDDFQYVDPDEKINDTVYNELSTEIRNS